MQYQISRNGQMYGPYTLEDLQRYVASGNVLATDLAKSEEMAEWVPVSTLLAAGTPPPAAPAFSEPLYGSAPVQAPVAAAVNQFQDAPNLHWGLVLLFGFLTCGYFMYVWNLIVSAWLKRVQPNATSMYLYLGALVLTVLSWFVKLIHGIDRVFNYGTIHTHYSTLGLFLVFAIWFVRLFARFSQMATLEEHFNGPEPVGLKLNGVLVFFFGGVYFQYKLNEINAMKQAARFGTQFGAGNVRPY
jgi:hypothetical protein